MDPGKCKFAEKSAIWSVLFCDNVYFVITRHFVHSFLFVLEIDDEKNLLIYTNYSFVIKVLVHSLLIGLFSIHQHLRLKDSKYYKLLA